MNEWIKEIKHFLTVYFGFRRLSQPLPSVWLEQMSSNHLLSESNINFFSQDVITEIMWDNIGPKKSDKHIKMLISLNIMKLCCLC